jgi:DNA-binding transcriptional ArsR family regulator
MNDKDLPANPDVCEVEVFDPERVAKARGDMLPPDQIDRLAAIYQCLGHSTRVKIIHALLSQELCVCDLSQVLGMTVSAVSHQLRTLRTVRLVKNRKDGKMVYYSIDDEHVRLLYTLGLEHILHK